LAWNLGNVPTWLAAVGTVGAVGLALRQIATERTLRKRAEDQALELQERSQAQLLSAWFRPGGQSSGVDPDWLILLNHSNEPVYQVVASMVFVQGAAPHTGEELGHLPDHQRPISIVPPGRWRVPVPSGWGGMFRRPGAELAFSDRNGLNWIRRASGSLEKTATNAYDHYKLSKPLSLIYPDPDLE
jgi:hypothetical protein